MKKIKAKEVIKVEEGKHTGIIKSVVERTDKFDYVDLIIGLDDTPSLVELKAGYPFSISEVSSLGRLLERFGIKVIPNDEYDVESLLKGKKVSFVTMNEKTERGTFSRIVPESVKPL